MGDRNSRHLDPSARRNIKSVSSTPGVFIPTGPSATRVDRVANDCFFLKWGGHGVTEFPFLPYMSLLGLLWLGLWNSVIRIFNFCSRSSHSLPQPHKKRNPGKARGNICGSSCCGCFDWAVTGGNKICRHVFLCVITAIWWSYDVTQLTLALDTSSSSMLIKQQTILQHLLKSNRTKTRAHTDI